MDLTSVKGSKHQTLAYTSLVAKHNHQVWFTPMQRCAHKGKVLPEKALAAGGT